MQLHQDAFVRTTIDLPEELYRALKARAALTGVTLRDLVRRLIEQGLRQPVGEKRPAERRDPPPVIIAPRGVPIHATSRADRQRFEEGEDEERHARSTRR